MDADMTKTTEDPGHTAFKRLSEGWTRDHERLVRLRARVLIYCTLALGLGTAIGWWL